MEVLFEFFYTRQLHDRRYIQHQMRKIC